MKFKYLLLLLPLVIMFLMGFVDPNSYPVYSGSLSFIDTQYTPVQTLSGSCQFWLNDYDCALSSDNYLVNVSSGSLTGTVQVGNTEYNCRISSGSSVFEIYQEYRTTYGTSSAWIDYHLIPDQLPSDSGSSFDSWLIVLAVAFLSILAVFGVVKFILG